MAFFLIKNKKPEEIIKALGLECMSAVSAPSELWVSMGLGMIKPGGLSEKSPFGQCTVKWTWRELATGNLGGRNDYEVSRLIHLL